MQNHHLKGGIKLALASDTSTLQETAPSLCTVTVDLFSSISCVKLYAQQHFTSCFISVLLAYSSINNNGIYFRVYFLFIAVQSRKPYPSEFQQTKNLIYTISDI
ncbi:conserved hypothetical protein [Trichinella spiralis]|uniref:hypothetical protein n=1 Tax=Trichinella spiralis TaxID=6334 RepID=UPI0001EFDD90|nr:conserved hypothetical protein [Trichinella spiralis]